MQVMEESLIQLFEEKKISLEQALEAANDPAYIKRELINRGYLR
jgi:Tfp pilus assembly pilus retraction ATPase PilT